MRVLYQFPLSLFCEKARWLLDHKELDYVAKNLTPGVHRLFAQIKTGQHQLPVLHDQKKWVADSTDIAEYLDHYYPEHALFRANDEMNQEILKIDQQSQVLGDHVRRWLFSFILNQPDKTTPLDIILGEKGLLRNFEKISVPTLKFALKHSHQVVPEHVAKSKQAMDELITEFNHILTENGGRYLVGDRLTLADIAVCSMLAPILMIEGTPWEMPNANEVPQEVIDYQQQLLNLPLGQYVKRIYETERNARIDWRGV